MRTASVIPGQPQAAVYILQRLDRRRFKVGWSIAPLQRIRLLPEFGAHELDLSASTAAWLPTRRRAEQVEDAIHKCLAPYSAETNHRSDGHSEWFLPEAHPMALRMLGQMPLDLRVNRPARLTAMKFDPPPCDAVSIHTGPQDTWWALEDLWTRIAMHCPVSTERDGDSPLLTFTGFKRIWDCPTDVIRRQVMDMQTYRWRAQGIQGDFVRTIDCRGDDLLCQLTSSRLMEKWPDGGDLVWQVRSFLVRLERTRCPMPIAATGSAR